MTFHGVKSQSTIDTLSKLDPDTLGWPKTSYALLEHAARTYPNRPALTYIADPAKYDNFERYSFSELLKKVTQTANGFTSLGIGAGEVVAYCLPNLPQTHFTLWGGEAAGSVMAVNPSIDIDLMEALLRKAGAKILVLTYAIYASAKTILENLESLEHLVFVDELPANTSKNSILFDELIAKQDDSFLLRIKSADSDEICSLFCTGGTTGAPKIAMRSHRAETSNAVIFAETLGKNITEHSVFLCGLPLFHVNAITATGLSPWYRGAEVILAGPAGYRDPSLIKNFWAIVERFGVTFFSGVPTIYAALLEQDTKPHDISSLNAAICGAAPMPTELFKRFETATGVRILEGYGLTEGGCVSTINPIEGERQVGSIGLGLPWQNICISDVDEAGQFIRECDIDEVGAVLIAGRNVFEGYKDPAQEAGIWVDRGDGQRWLNTGDLGRRDKDGYFWLTGRRKELIIRGGHNIDPATIEEPMNQHPTVAMAAAVGRPDSYAGEVPVVYVQLREGADISETALMDFAKENISERAAIPKAVHIIDALPLTAVGKIFKPKLLFSEIEKKILGEASAHNITLSSVLARQDNKLGVIAEIIGVSDETAMRAALSAYTFKTKYLES